MVSPESEALRSCISALNKTLASGNVCLSWFATELYEKAFIGFEVYSNCISATAQGRYAKASNLTVAVVSRLGTDPQSFLTFLAILQEKAALNVVTNKLLEKYAQLDPCGDHMLMSQKSFEAIAIRTRNKPNRTLDYRGLKKSGYMSVSAGSQHNWNDFGGTTMTDSSIVAENTPSHAANQRYLQLEDISTMPIQQERVPSPVGSQSLQHFPIQRTRTESDITAKLLDHIMLESKNKDTRILGLEEELRKSRAELKTEREKGEREREKLKQSLTEQQHAVHLEKQYQQQTRTLPKHLSEGPTRESHTDGLTPKVAVSRSTTQPPSPSSRIPVPKQKSD